MGLVPGTFAGGSSREVFVGEIGDVTGVQEAMVPPTPTREVLILSGAFLVIEHDEGGMLATGAMMAGL
jgi:hypothetical protein